MRFIKKRHPIPGLQRLRKKFMWRRCYIGDRRTEDQTMVWLGYVQIREQYRGEKNEWFTKEICLNTPLDVDNMEEEIESHNIPILAMEKTNEIYIPDSDDKWAVLDSDNEVLYTWNNRKNAQDCSRNTYGLDRRVIKITNVRPEID